MGFKRTFVEKGKLRAIGNGFECSVSTNLARLIYRRTFTHYAWAISKTYIDGSSSLYVTAINDATRDDITDRLEDKDPNNENDGNVELYQELQNIFDDPATEVYAELKKSYIRFAYTPQFERIKMNQNVQSPSQKQTKQ